MTTALIAVGALGLFAIVVAMLGCDSGEFSRPIRRG
jgi:hypothetical protein